MKRTLKFFEKIESLLCRIEARKKKRKGPNNYQKVYFGLMCLTMVSMMIIIWVQIHHNKQWNIQHQYLGIWGLKLGMAGFLFAIWYGISGLIDIFNETFKKKEF